MEAKEGRPFVGPSGKLLDVVLDNAGIDRQQTYVDNVVACRPQDNRTPTPLEVRCCYPRLRHEIASRKPDTIIALGNTAAQAILNTKEGVTKLRVGPPKESETFPGARVVATVHPAYCLRTADAFPHLVADIEKAGPNAPITGWQPPTFKVFDEPREAVLVLREIGRKYDTLVVDIEVGIDKDTDFDHPERYQFLCVGLGYAPGRAVVIGEQALRDSQVQRELKVLLDTKKWIAHNGKFDLAGLQQFGTPVLYFDTMLASYVLDERPGVHGLKYLAVELLGAPQYDDELKRYVGRGDSYALVPRDILYTYNAYDVACTWALYEYYLQKFDEQGRKLHDFLVECSNALMHGEMRGISVDIGYLDHLTDHYLDGLGDLEERLKPWVDNPRSPKQVKEALGKLGIKAVDTRKETLRNALAKAKPTTPQFEFLDLMLKQRREQKLYGTYVKGTRKRLYKDRVHPTFLLHGTTTGRLACRNPNLQNVPRESSIRRLFVPGPGNAFVQADYATIELRVLATEAEDEFFRTVFAEGRDIHDEFSLRLFGEGFTKEQRVRTKAFVYGVSYGREAFSIAQEYKIPVQEAEQLMASFTDTIPATMAFREEIKRKILEDQDDLVTHFGRRRRFWLITDDNKKDVVKEGLAFIPQSTASDINLHSLIRLRKMGLDVRLPVHDSILVECKEQDASEVGRIMSTVMSETATEVYSDYVPFPVDVEIGYSWGDLGKEKYWEDPDMEEDE